MNRCEEEGVVILLANTMRESGLYPHFVLVHGHQQAEERILACRCRGRRASLLPIGTPQLGLDYVE